jgi:hypothetical protein
VVRSVKSPPESVYGSLASWGCYCEGSLAVSLRQRRGRHLSRVKLCRCLRDRRGNRERRNNAQQTNARCPKFAVRARGQIGESTVSSHRNPSFRALQPKPNHPKGVAGKSNGHHIKGDLRHIQTPRIASILKKSLIWSVSCPKKRTGPETKRTQGEIQFMEACQQPISDTSARPSAFNSQRAALYTQGIPASGPNLSPLPTRFCRQKVRGRGAYMHSRSSTKRKSDAAKAW